MNYYEATCPFYVLIKAPNEEEAIVTYAEAITGIPRAEHVQFMAVPLIEPLREVSQPFAIGQYATVVEASNPTISLSKLMKIVEGSHTSVALIVEDKKKKRLVPHTPL